MLKEILNIGVHAFLGFSCGYLLMDRWFLKRKIKNLEIMTLSHETRICNHLRRQSRICRRIDSLENPNLKREGCSKYFCSSDCDTLSKQECIICKADKDNSMMVKEECSHNFCGDSCQ